ncbi:tetratricopeptide repeat protein [Polyangium spumosum]|uniref:Tetratricopeptide repeat protein n=1 Tax=Polyangium spumosum TaxID=889282 RepID=A0A6N7PZP5_9BACT|nr:tetratricopeptide repeat protein [Polyangium spumosum]MRG97473.1 tetratricopeptide repeat protein [Polyangium spumosum]
MVLPAPPADDAPREGAWLDAIQRELRLSDAGKGLLILVDQARPERLRDLVLALLPTYPDLEVYTDVRAVYEVPEGAVMILAPRAEDADWLNQQRPLFARRKLKVILWCEAETSVALAQKAVDFFDWISHRHECPPGVPMHAVYGIRAALCARAPGIVWRGNNLEACFRVALPGRELVHLSAQLSHEELVQAIRDAGHAWLVVHDAADQADVLKVESALEELRIKTRIIGVDGYLGLRPPNLFWGFKEYCLGLIEARAALAALGARAPGRLAALAALEPEAIKVIELGFRRGIAEMGLDRSMRDAEDPGAAVVRLVEDDVPWLWVMHWRALLWRGTGRRWPSWLLRPPKDTPLAWVAFFAAKDALRREDVREATRWARSSYISADGDREGTSVELANALRALALTYASRKQFDNAASHLHQALRMAEIRLGPDDPFLGGLYGDLAEVLAQKGDFDEAMRLAERAFQIEKSVPSLSSPYMSRAYKRIGHIQSLRDRAPIDLTPTHTADKTTASPPPPSPDTPPRAATAPRRT